MLLTFLRALSPCKPLCCKLRILALVCYNCTGTTDTNGTLLTLFEYRAGRDIPFALFIRHVVCETAHVPHCLREGSDLAINDLCTASVCVGMSVSRDHCDTIVQPLLLHGQHLLYRIKLYIYLCILAKAAGPVLTVLSHSQPQPVCSACINRSQVHFTIGSFLQLLTKCGIIIPGLYRLVIQSILLKDVCVPVHYGSAYVCRNTDSCAICSGVYIQTSLYKRIFIRSKCICHIVQRAILTNVVRELTDLDIAHIRCAAASLQGHHQLVVHVRVRISTERDLDLLVRILLIPLIYHVCVELIVYVYE